MPWVCERENQQEGEEARAKRGEGARGTSRRGKMETKMPRWTTLTADPWREASRITAGEREMGGGEGSRGNAQGPYRR